MKLKYFTLINEIFILISLYRLEYFLLNTLCPLKADQCSIPLFLYDLKEFIVLSLNIAKLLDEDKFLLLALLQLNLSSRHLRFCLKIGLRSLVRLQGLLFIEINRLKA